MIRGADGSGSTCAFSVWAAAFAFPFAYLSNATATISHLDAHSFAASPGLAALVALRASGSMIGHDSAESLGGEHPDETYSDTERYPREARQMRKTTAST